MTKTNKPINNRATISTVILVIFFTIAIASLFVNKLNASSIRCGQGTIPVENCLFLPIINSGTTPVATPLPTVIPTATATPTASWIPFRQQGKDIDVVAIHDKQLFAGDSTETGTGKGVYSWPQNSCDSTIPPSFVLQDKLILDLAFNATNGLAASFGQKVYYSNDHGNSWSQTASNMNANVYSVVFTKHDGQAYAGTDIGIYRSENNGQSWNFINGSPRLINALNYDPINDYLWIATYGDGIWRLKANTTEFESQKNGLSTPAAKQVWQILIRSADDLYIATDDGIYKGSGNGTWTLFGQTLNDTRSMAEVDGILYVGTKANGVQTTSLTVPESWVPTAIKEPTGVRYLLYDQTGLCNDPITNRNALLAATTDGIWIYR